MQLSAPTDFTSAREAGRWRRIHPEDRSERGGANRLLATATLPRPVSKSTGWTAHAHCTGRAAAPRSGHGIRGSMQPACQPSFAAFRVPGNFFPPSGRLPNDRGRCCVKNHCAGHPRRRRCCGIVRRRAAAATLRSFPRTSVLADSIDLLNCLRRRQNLRHTVQRQEAAPDRGCGVRHSVYMYLAARLELPACARWQAARHAKSAAGGMPRRRQERWHLRCVLRRGKRKRRLPVAMTSSAPTVIRDGVLVGSQQGTRAARAGVPGPECRGGGGRGRACAAGVRGVV